MDNIKTITIGILSNKMTNLKCHNGTYKIFLNPISLTLESFKNAFYPCNYFKPNEFVSITTINHYTVCNYHMYSHLYSYGNVTDVSYNSLCVSTYH